MSALVQVERFRLLLIEDDAGREQEFRSWLPPGVLMSWAQSAGTAMGVIRRDSGHVWSAVMLDHDLAQRARTEDDLALSGTDVALALIDHFCVDIPILVHRTRTASINVLTPRTGGRPTSTLAERELDVLLEPKPARKPRRSSPSGGSRRTGNANGASSPAAHSRN